MKGIILSLILLCQVSAIAQTPNNKTAFDSIYYEIALNITSSDPSKAMHLADSLYIYAIDDHQKTRALMLSANILDKQEDRKAGIEYAMKALELAKKSKDYSFEARIYGFMSTQYRRMGFSDKGKEYILKGLEASSKMEDKAGVSKFQAMANHELADYAMIEKKYEKAIEYLKLAHLGYQKEENPKHRKFVIGNAEELLGRCYLALGDYDQAFNHFSKAKTLIKNSDLNNSIYASMIYQGVGAMFLERKEMDSAETYLKKALVIGEKSEHGSLKALIYESMTKYYREVEKLDSSAIYAAKYKDITKENNFKKNQMVNSEFNRVISEPEQKSNSTSIYLVLTVILGLGTISTLYYFRRKKTSEIILQDKNEERNSTNGVQISVRTQEELLKKLEEFEASELFLDKDMSLSVLIGYLNTNVKYLNHILKNIKEKDFNTYINDLRIEYIISKLRSDPDFLNYKISYLAEISGFSSHSNFSANFKRVTEFSPSEYIENINRSI